MKHNRDTINERSADVPVIMDITDGQTYEIPHPTEVDTAHVMDADEETFFAIPAPPAEMGIEWPPKHQPRGRYPGEVSFYI